MLSIELTPTRVETVNRTLEELCRLMNVQLQASDFESLPELTFYNGIAKFKVDTGLEESSYTDEQPSVLFNYRLHGRVVHRVMFDTRKLLSLLDILDEGIVADIVLATVTQYSSKPVGEPAYTRIGGLLGIGLIDDDMSFIIT